MHTKSVKKKTNPVKTMQYCVTVS